MYFMCSFLIFSKLGMIHRQAHFLVSIVCLGSEYE